MQLCCYYIATYATICNLCNYIATYATILQLYAIILQQFRMQLYENMQLYATMQHATYATQATLWNLCKFTQLYCNLCNYIATFGTIGKYMQLMKQYYNLCNYMQLMQLYATILQLYATILQLMQLYCNYIATILYATICNMPYATSLSNDKSFKNSM